MNFNELRLLNLLCARLGIETLKELEAFKLQRQASTNKMLLDQLLIYAASKVNNK